MKKQLIFKVLLIIPFLILYACKDDESVSSDDGINPPQATELEVKPDGKLNILILGTSTSISSTSSEFRPHQLALQLHKILEEDASHNLEVNVVSEDIYASKSVTVGLGGNGSIFNWNHYRHSLFQYYFWPDGQAKRLKNLAGQENYSWDYVVIASDPFILSKIPAYFALGVNKIASKVFEGGAKPLLLMNWPKDYSTTAPHSHFSEFTYRVAEGSAFGIETIPAAIAWDALPNEKKDQSNQHPSPNGSYLSAASIYSHISDRSAAISNYQYDDEIADHAYQALKAEIGKPHYSGTPNHISPFNRCGITDDSLNYNQTGSSSERGILDALNWVVNQSSRTLIFDGTPPIEFNYGRANTNFEPSKRYQVNPSLFDFSFGFPMQDHSNHGDLSMLYGIDQRDSETENGTDLGVALYMVRNSETPYARAIPIRTLYALLKEAIPNFSAYRDSWHMNRTLDKAVASYMFTLLTSDCDLGMEPIDKTSLVWQDWMAQKIGYETAYTFMSMKGNIPSCN